MYVTHPFHYYYFNPNINIVNNINEKKRNFCKKVGLGWERVVYNELAGS